MPRTKLFTVEDVLAKAVSRFSTHGYHATSINDLTLLFGIGRGSIYDTFGSKRGLFEHLAGQWHPQNHVQHSVRYSCARPRAELGDTASAATVSYGRAAPGQAGAWLRIDPGPRGGLLGA